MNELQLSITHLRQVCTFPSRNAARSKEALPRRGKVRWNEGSMGTSELRHARTLHGDAVCTRYIHPVRRPNRPPRVAHWMPVGSTLVPCRAGTRELVTVARDVHAAGNPQHHTVDTQASAEVGWFYEGGGRTWAMAGASMLMRSTVLRMVNNVEVIRDIVVEGELAEVGLKLDQTARTLVSLHSIIMSRTSTFAAAVVSAMLLMLAPAMGQVSPRPPFISP